jgi:A/G-specific adenine glycosylase
MDRASALLDWYGRNRRDFPWRRTRDPWAILSVEVMSQQTQIARVEGHWTAWMERFPDPAACAAATPAEVVRLWSGLGYNSRARRLHESASIVAEEGWPRTVAGLRRLPGVGPYTAAAVACQAFGVQVPTVDTNHKRVLSRWVGEPLAGRRLEVVAVEELSDGLAEDWNQALMDLGAGVCLPSPRCDDCPVTQWCIDPGIYTPPPAQAPYRGSSREARGKVLARLAEAPATVAELADRTGIPTPRITRAVEALASESAIVAFGDGWAVPGAFPESPTLTPDPPAYPVN